MQISRPRHMFAVALVIFAATASRGVAQGAAAQPAKTEFPRTVTIYGVHDVRPGPSALKTGPSPNAVVRSAGPAIRQKRTTSTQHPVSALSALRPANGGAK